jgi:hypothetical protein
VFKWLGLFSPQAWGGIALAAFLALSGAFGAGYEVASSHAIRIEATAAQGAAKAQEVKDAAQHRAAQDTSDIVKKSDTDQGARVITVVKTIHDLEPNPQKSCDVPPDVLKALNTASQP